MSPRFATVAASHRLFVPSDEAVEQFQRQGALRLAGLASSETLLALADDLESLLLLKEHQHGIRKKTTPREVGPRVEALGQRLEELEQIHTGALATMAAAMPHMPAVVGTAVSEKLVSVVRRFLSPRIQLHPRLSCQIVPAGDAAEQLWRQDWEALGGWVDGLVIFLPLTPVDTEATAPRVALEEFQRGVLPHGAAAADNRVAAIDAAATDRFAQVAAVELAAGDGLVLHPLTPYALPAAATGTVRISLLLRYLNLEANDYCQADWRLQAD